MAVFDQRGQQVGNQTNIAGNVYNAGRDVIHVEGNAVIAGRDAWVRELDGLIGQVGEAAKAGDLDGDAAVDVEYSLKKAQVEAKKPEADKSKLMGYLDTAKSTLEKAASISKSVGTLAAALAAAYAKAQGWL